MKNYLLHLAAVALLASCAQPQPAQTDEVKTKGRDTELTYVMPQPYEVPVIEAPKGNKVKNVILMIGDGMSLMHVYSAWTANRGHLYLDNCQAVGLSKTYCTNKLITDS